MPWNLILFHSALFFIYVMIYIALLTSSLTFAGKLGPMEMNLWLATDPAIGFFLFGFTFRRFSRKQFRQMLAGFLGVLGIAIVTLGLGVSANAGPVCTGIGLLLFPLGTGYIYGYLHYLMCRWLPAGRRGLCIGLGFALPNLLQFLVDWLLKITAAPPLFLWGLLLVILVLMAALLLRTESWGLAEQPIAPRPLIIRSLPLLCSIGAVMGLLVGLNDTVSLVRYDEYVDFHFLSRVYSAIGYLLTGWLADRYPMWLPLTALLSKAVVLGFHVLALEGYPFWITVCGDAFFTAALNLFVIWLFVSVALNTRRPELWAGMGRAVELPLAGLGGMLGAALLQAFPMSVTLLVFVASLLLAVVLFYRCILLYSDSLLKSRAPIPLPQASGKAIFAGPVAVAEAPIPADENVTVDTQAVLAGETETVDMTAAPTGEPVIVDMQATPAGETETADITAAPAGETAENALEFYPDAEETEPDAGADPEMAPEVEPEGNTLETEPVVTRGTTGAGSVYEERLRNYKIRYQLSVRETEVLEQILQDRPINEIANVLFISPRTVKFHVASLLKKTGSNSQRGLRLTLREFDRLLEEEQNKKAGNN